MLSKLEDILGTEDYDTACQVRVDERLRNIFLFQKNVEIVVEAFREYEIPITDFWCDLEDLAEAISENHQEILEHFPESAELHVQTEFTKPPRSTLTHGHGYWPLANVPFNKEITLPILLILREFVELCRFYSDCVDKQINLRLVRVSREYRRLIKPKLFMYFGQISVSKEFEIDLKNAAKTIEIDISTWPYKPKELTPEQFRKGLEKIASRLKAIKETNSPNTKVQRAKDESSNKREKSGVVGFEPDHIDDYYQNERNIERESEETDFIPGVYTNRKRNGEYRDIESVRHGHIQQTRESRKFEAYGIAQIPNEVDKFNFDAFFALADAADVDAWLEKDIQALGLLITLTDLPLADLLRIRCVKKIDSYRLCSGDKIIYEPSSRLIAVVLSDSYSISPNAGDPSLFESSSRYRLFYLPALVGDHLWANWRNSEKGNKRCFLKSDSHTYSRALKRQFGGRYRKRLRKIYRGYLASLESRGTQSSIFLSGAYHRALGATSNYLSARNEDLALSVNRFSNWLDARFECNEGRVHFPNYLPSRFGSERVVELKVIKEAFKPVARVFSKTNKPTQLDSSKNRLKKQALHLGFELAIYSASRGNTLEKISLDDLVLGLDLMRVSDKNVDGAGAARLSCIPKAFWKKLERYLSSFNEFVSKYKPHETGSALLQWPIYDDKNGHDSVRFENLTEDTLFRELGMPEDVPTNFSRHLIAARAMDQNFPDPWQISILGHRKEGCTQEDLLMDFNFIEYRDQGQEFMQKLIDSLTFKGE